MKNTKNVSLEELRMMHERGETFPDSSTADEVEMPEGFWDDAEVLMREPKKSVHLRVDADVFEFFRAEGKGHLTRMQAVLRSYVEAQKSRYTPR